MYVGEYCFEKIYESESAPRHAHKATGAITVVSSSTWGDAWNRSCFTEKPGRNFHISNLITSIWIFGNFYVSNLIICIWIFTFKFDNMFMNFQRFSHFEFDYKYMNFHDEYCFVLVTLSIKNNAFTKKFVKFNFHI